MDQEVLKYLNGSRDDAITFLQQLVRQPSVSAELCGVRECAEILAERHSALGFQQVEVVDTAGLPGLYAYFDAGSRCTLVVYAMIDSNLVGDLGAWSFPPFGGDIVSLDGFPEVIVGRGSRTKGPYATFLWAIEALVKTKGNLPVNVACFLDGEEWLGSTHYRDVVRRHRASLRNVVGGISPSAGQSRSGEVSLTLGTRGFLYFDLVASGKNWGRGPVTDHVHSSAQSVVDSPAWRLVQALNTLCAPGEDCFCCAVPGFYDDIEEPAGERLALLERIAERWRGRDLREVLPGIAGVGRVERFCRDDLDTVDLLKQYLYRPTFNINGLSSGYTGPGSTLFTLPGEARCRIDARFPPRQDFSKILKSLRTHLNQHGYRDIEIRTYGAYEWSQCSLSDHVVKANITCLSEEGISPLIWPTRASSAPFGILQHEIGCPVLSAVGLGYSGGAHGTDEYFVLEGDGKVRGVSECAMFFCRYLSRLQA
ncbi:MAG: M20/M25/M40 family metallo-hydrolase [Bacillota bacterium]|nr:M20/M25/M40 family metallo-hydrolase [Bacillota bacterium]